MSFFCLLYRPGTVPFILFNLEYFFFSRFLDRPAYEDSLVLSIYTPRGLDSPHHPLSWEEVKLLQISHPFENELYRLSHSSSLRITHIIQRSHLQQTQVSRRSGSLQSGL